METVDLKFIEEPRGPFVPFLPEVCMMADIQDNQNLEIPTLSKLITVQSNSVDCHTTFASVSKRNTRFNVDGNRVLVQAFLYVASHSESYLPPYSPVSFAFVTISFWPAIETSGKYSASRKRSLAGPVWPMRSTLLYMIAITVHMPVRTISDSGT